MKDIALPFSRILYLNVKLSEWQRLHPLNAGTVTTIICTSSRKYLNTMMENVVVFVYDKMNAILTGLLDEELESLNEFKYL